MHHIPKGLLLEEDAKKIKILLWEGHLTQKAIAELYGMAQPTISRIMTGRDWGNLPWPDGTTGAFPLERKRVVHRSRHRNTRYATQLPSTHTSQEDREENANPDAIKEAAKAFLLEDAEVLADIVSRVGTKEEREESSSEFIPYVEIKEADPSHPIVRILQEREDGPLKYALREVCSQIGQDSWQRPETIDTINKIADSYRSNVEKK